MEKAGVGSSPPGHNAGLDKAFLTKSTITDSSSPMSISGDEFLPEPWNGAKAWRRVEGEVLAAF